MPNNSRLFSQFKEIISYREMLFSSVKKDLRSRYRGSILGFLWTFLNPLMQLAIYSIVFPFLLKMQEDNYPLFVFVGLLPWIWFTSSLAISTTSIVANGSLVKKIYFPRMIIPLGISITGAVHFLFGLIIVIAALLIAHIPLTPYILLTPIIIIIQWMFTAGLSMILSAAYVYFRDLEHIISIVTQGWFYLTPIVYNAKIFPEWAQKLLLLNPMAQFVTFYRNSLLYGQPPHLPSLLIITVVSALFFLLGAKIFLNLQKNFAEEI